jgi:hypothetical protein
MRDEFRLALVDLIQGFLNVADLPSLHFQIVIQCLFQVPGLWAVRRFGQPVKQLVLLAVDSE